MTGNDLWIFEIPIYRITQDEWLQEVTQLVDDWVTAHLEASYAGPDRERERSRVTALAQHQLGAHGWHYNEVVAWIRIKIDGEVIKAYSWDVQQKQFRRGFKPFPFEGGVTSKLPFEILIDNQSVDRNREIYAELRDQLVGLSAPDGSFPRRYIDLRAFDAVAPHLDWRAVVGRRR